MAEREAQIGQFLAAHGWGEADVAVMAADASFRRYLRLTRGNESAVLMDAPPPQENVGPFVRMARHLKGLGFSAPDVMAEDARAGLLILEDLGDDTFTRVLSSETAAVSEEPLYALAVDVLIDLHRRPATETVPKGLAPYGNGRLLDEAFLLPEWYLPAVTGGEAASEETRRAYGEAWLQVFPAVHAQPKTLVLRDFHVDNLILLPGRDGIERCGLLDFQDAVSGAAAYDLMSLLEDARRDIDESLKAAMLVRYLDAFPEIDRDAFMAAFNILGAQRHAKVIGIFTRLSARDGKAQYLNHIPRVWRLLAASLASPALKPVADWFETHVPAALRLEPEAPREKQS